MVLFKSSKKKRSKNALFNPYENAISTNDMTYLSSKRDLKHKIINPKFYIQKAFSMNK